MFEPGQLLRYRCDTLVFFEHPILGPDPKVVPHGQLAIVLYSTDVLCYILTRYGICCDWRMGFLESNTVIEREFCCYGKNSSAWFTDG